MQALKLKESPDNAPIFGKFNQYRHLLEGRDVPNLIHDGITLEGIAQLYIQDEASKEEFLEKWEIVPVKWIIER